MVVCRDDHERHLLNSSDIHSFVARTGLHTAFADAREADQVFLALKSFRQQRAYRDRNHRAEMTDHREFVLARMTSMNVAVASAHRAEARAEIRACHVKERFAKCGTSGLVANQWREDIAFLQKYAACDADCLLAVPDVPAH